MLHSSLWYYSDMTDPRNLIGCIGYHLRRLGALGCHWMYCAKDEGDAGRLLCNLVSTRAPKDSQLDGHHLPHLWRDAS